MKPSDVMNAYRTLVESYLRDMTNAGVEPTQKGVEELLKRAGASRVTFTSPDEIEVEFSESIPMCTFNVTLENPE